MLEEVRRETPSLTQAHSSLRSYIESCFEMKEWGQLQATPPTIHRHQGHFTPEYFPGRYALKDDMYSQYPAVLDKKLAKEAIFSIRITPKMLEMGCDVWEKVQDQTGNRPFIVGMHLRIENDASGWNNNASLNGKLLDHVLKQNWESGVRYVEFSVGVGDVMRPWIWNHLAKPQCEVKSLKEMNWRYLAGFGRTKTTLKLTNPNQQGAIDAPIHFEELHPLEQIIHQCQEYPEVLGGCGVDRLCVGLDDLGDEETNPDCPFRQLQFFQFLKRTHHSR